MSEDLRQGLLTFVAHYVGRNGLPPEAEKKFLDYKSARGQFAMEIPSMLMGRPVRYMAPFDSRVAKLASGYAFGVFEVGGKQETRCLITQRTLDMPDAPGQWGFPGGNANRGETFRQAAARQFAEEVGLKIDPEDLAFAGEYEGSGDFGGEIGREQVQQAFILLLEDEQVQQLRPKDETKALDWVSNLNEVGPVGTAKFGLGFPEIDGLLFKEAWQEAHDRFYF